MARGSGVLLIAMLLAGATAVAQTTMTWTVDTDQRQALVFAPPQGPSTNAHSLPLVFAFHGHGGTMQSAAQGMHLQTLWPQAIIVYPQGLPTKS